MYQILEKDFSGSLQNSFYSNTTYFIIKRKKPGASTTTAPTEADESLFYRFKRKQTVKIHCK